MGKVLMKEAPQDKYKHAIIKFYLFHTCQGIDTRPNELTDREAFLREAERLKSNKKFRTFTRRKAKAKGPHFSIRHTKKK